MNVVTLIIGMILSLIGFIFFTLALTVVRKMKIKTDRLVKHGNMTTAVVKENVEEVVEKSQIYYVILEYEFQGNIIQKKGGIGYPKKPEYQVGQKVEIYHDQTQPDEFVIVGEERIPRVNFNTYLALGSIFGGIGLILIWLSF